MPSFRSRIGKIGVIGTHDDQRRGLNLPQPPLSRRVRRTGGLDERVPVAWLRKPSPDPGAVLGQVRRLPPREEVLVIREPNRGDVIVPPSYRLAERRSVGLTELRDEAFAGLKKGYDMRDLMDHYCQLEPTSCCPRRWWPYI